MKNTVYKVLFCCLAVTAAIEWYHFFVAPNDTMLNEVMTCVDSDRSRLAYDQCFKEYAAQRR